MPIQTSAGTTLQISANLPTSETESDYGTLSFSNVGEITNIPEYGTAYNPVTFVSLDNRRTRKYKGSYDNGDVTLELGRDPDDAGQGVLQDALDSDNDYAFKVTLQDGTIQYFSGKVMSYTTNPGGTDQIVGASAQIGITTDIIEVAAP